MKGFTRRRRFHQPYQRVARGDEVGPDAEPGAPDLPQGPGPAGCPASARPGRHWGGAPSGLAPCRLAAASALVPEGAPHPTPRPARAG
ncbi:MAG: hypothetical protein ACK56I_08355, partial [bacterium]